MAIVAGLFDSEADASKAIDRLSREGLDDLDTRVVNGSARTGNAEPGVVMPIIPNTSGGPSQAGMGPEGVGVNAAPVLGDWMNNMDEVERNFYQDALREGSTLVLAKVHDEDAGRVGLIFSTFGGRTYKKD